MAIVALALLAAACAGTGPKPGTEFRDCVDCPVMVVIPPAEFRMGFDGGEEGRPEGPVRAVEISYRFAVGKHEVTQQQFAAFIIDTGYLMRGGCQVWQGEWRSPPDADWTNPGYGRVPFDDEPVACVSWLDARAFVAWLARRTGESYRLLSEAEWEYVARAGTATEYFWAPRTPTAAQGTAHNEQSDGNASVACRYANVYDTSGQKVSAFSWEPFSCDDGFGQAAPVGSFEPNAFGVHDMIGNVWEWTADCYQAPYPAGPVDGSPVQPQQAPCEKRVARGGSWITRPSRQRVSFRGRDPEETLYSFFGFRVARDL